MTTLVVMAVRDCWKESEVENVKLIYYLSPAALTETNMLLIA